MAYRVLGLAASLRTARCHLIPAPQESLKQQYGFAARVGFAAVAMPRRLAARITWALPLVRAIAIVTRSHLIALYA